MGTFYFSVGVLSRQKRVMRRIMSNPYELKLIFYTDHTIELNEYLATSLGANATDNIGVTELNGILLNGMKNGWSKQAYVQGFYCETFF